MTARPPDRHADPCVEPLHRETARVAALLRSIGPVPDGPRLGRWDLADTAVHLSQVWTGLPGLAFAPAPTDPAAGDAEVDTAAGPISPAGGGLIGAFADLGTFTEGLVRAEPERDLVVLADRIQRSAATYLAGRDDDPDRPRPWLVSGVRVPLPVFSAHLLSETVMHGRDIARAAGRPWEIDPTDAELAARGFLFAVLFASGPTLLDGAKVARARGRYRLELGVGPPYVLEVDSTEVHEVSDPGRVDCRISVPATTFLLMFFGRVSPVVAMARGGLRLGGRRPWLAPLLMAALPTA